MRLSEKCLNMKSKCEKAYLKGVNLSGVGRDWDEIWENFKGLNWFGRRLKKEQGRVLKKILSEIKLARSAKIVDVGCGPGFTLSLFRGLGYDNSIGIDLSNNSLTLCNKLFGFKGEKMFSLWMQKTSSFLIIPLT
jgi:cyclopropane fatty-acyl-phospholipid synthase-like methyltransferase